MKRSIWPRRESSSGRRRLLEPLMYDHRSAKRSPTATANMLLPIPVDRRKINAPEMTVSVSLQCLKNEARGDAVSDTCLDNLALALGDASDTKSPGRVQHHRHSKARSFADQLESLWLPFPLSPAATGSQNSEATATRPRNSERLMKPLLPILVGLVVALGTSLLELIHRDIPDRHPGLNRIGCQDPIQQPSDVLPNNVEVFLASRPLPRGSNGTHTRHRHSAGFRFATSS